MASRHPNRLWAYSITKELSRQIKENTVMLQEFNMVGLSQPKMPEAEKGINSNAYQELH